MCHTMGGYRLDVVLAISKASSNANSVGARKKETSDEARIKFGWRLCDYWGRSDNKHDYYSIF